MAKTRSIATNLRPEATLITKIPFVDLAAQYQGMAEEIDSAIMDVVERADFILGDAVQKLESSFAAYCGAAFAVGVDSGTSALHLAMEAHGIGPGDEVITTANTFIATACAITYVGAKPVLVDVDPQTYTMDPHALEEAITARTKALIPVHLYGHPADMTPIMAIAQECDLIVIEDACQAHGARINGKRVGSLGHSAAFSFYPAKNLGAFGDGGAVVTDDEEIAHRLRLLRNFGQDQKNVHLFSGHNHRLDTLQASILLAKLPQLDDWNAARRRHAQRYADLLNDLPLGLPRVAADLEHVFHLYVVTVEDRDALAAFLQERGIASGVHYPTPIHLQPAFAHLGYGEGSFPVSERLANSLLSLPMYPELEDGQIEMICGAIRDYFSMLKMGTQTQQMQPIEAHQAE